MNAKLSKALWALGRSVPRPETAALINDCALEAERLEARAERELDDDVTDFQVKFGHPLRSSPDEPAPATVQRRMQFIREEVDELLFEYEKRNLLGVAHESVDVLYVVLGGLLEWGIRFRPVWDLVHRANMAKERGAPGEKTRKPAGWVSPKEGIYHEIQRQVDRRRA